MDPLPLDFVFYTHKKCIHREVIVITVILVIPLECATTTGFPTNIYVYIHIYMLSNIGQFTDTGDDIVEDMHHDVILPC
jgi:hypothetical protein